MALDSKKKMLNFEANLATVISKVRNVPFLGHFVPVRSLMNSNGTHWWDIFMTSKFSLRRQMLTDVKYLSLTSNI